jgi:hypothetical protein
MLEKSDVVFVGTVLAVNYKDERSEQTRFDIYFVSFEVSAMWKGEDKPVEVVVFSEYKHESPYTPKIGDRFLVFAFRTSASGIEGMLITSVDTCSRTKLLNDALLELYLLPAPKTKTAKYVEPMITPDNIVSSLSSDSERSGVIRTGDFFCLRKDASEVVPLLLDLLNTGCDEEKGRAIMALGALGPSAGAAEDDLVDCYKDGKVSWLRASALRTLCYIITETDDRLRLLVSGLKEPESAIQQAALACVHNSLRGADKQSLCVLVPTLIDISEHSSDKSNRQSAQSAIEYIEKHDVCSP